MTIYLNWQLQAYPFVIIPRSLELGISIDLSTHIHDRRTLLSGAASHVNRRDRLAAYIPLFR